MCDTGQPYNNNNNNIKMAKKAISMAFFILSSLLDNVCNAAATTSLTAFAPIHHHHRHHHGAKTTSSSSSPSPSSPSFPSALNMAVSPPTLIIGPMIRKMREDKAKKNMPLATVEEKAEEAPGLRVGIGAWKWPPVWPYDDEFFIREGDEKPMSSKVDQGIVNSMSMMVNGGLGGSQPMPNPEDVPPPEELKLLDSLEYWGVENKDVKTELDDEAGEKLKSHYAYYLQDGMSILEFGAAEESYLPKDIELSRHVGIGANMELMELNDALSERYVIDLNKVIPERGVDSDLLLRNNDKIESESFDVVLMANTVEYITEPRELFKTAWKLLKPGGMMFVSFTNREAYESKFSKAQTRMWRNYNDDQHMWVCGSFFQFSAGDGWDKLKGFDISPEGSDKSDLPVIGKLLNQNKLMNMYVVQATKAIISDEIDETNVEKSFESLMYMTPTLEQRDKMLVAPRMARAYTLLSSSDEMKKERIKENVKTLPKIYESLIKMDQFAFPFQLQAQLAVDLASDVDFVANDEQIAAMKMGLGLSKPSENFWAPVGKATAAMSPEDKVNLLTYIVPRFGSNNKEQEDALESFVTGLKPTIQLIQSKCPTMKLSDVQLLGSELLACEILIPGRSTKLQFVTWLSNLTEKEMEKFLSQRQSYKEVAKTEIQLVKDRRKAEEERLKNEEETFRKQVEQARKERSMVFNEETGKMEYIELKEDEKKKK